MDLPRDNSIGFVRVCLATAVIYQHTLFLAKAGPDVLNQLSPSTSTGELAVQCFFVLSGWLVTKSYQRNPSLFRYLWHRALRLLPALFFCLLVTAAMLAPLVYWTSSPAEQSVPDRDWWGYVARNIVYPRAQIWIGNLLHSNPWPRDWNGSLWTLFYEECAYLLVAAIGVIGLLNRRQSVALVGLAVLLVLSLAWSAAPSAFPHLIGRLFDTPGKLLVIHFIGGMIWALLPNWKILRSRWLVLASIAVLFVAWGFDGGRFVTPWALAPALFGLAEWMPFKRFERHVGGDYSYGLYLYGYPVQQTLAHFNATKLWTPVYGLLAFTVALILAVGSWKLIEGPALKLKDWHPRCREPARSAQSESQVTEFPSGS